MILEDYLRQHACRTPDRTALVIGSKSFTYRELDELVSETVDSLSGLKRRFLCFKAAPSVDFFASYFACHRLGVAAVPVSKEMPEVHLAEISTILESCSIPPRTADILFTTGTTGKSKGVMVSSRAIVADASNLVSAHGFSQDTVFVINGPLNHIGSLSKIFPVIMCGATMIIVDGLKDLNVFFEAFNYPSSKMATFLVPSSIRIILQFAEEKLASLASKMDFIETGAAAISVADMETLCRILPDTRLFNTYASTETGIICTYDFNEGGCVAGCLGRPMKNSDFFITPEGLVACTGDTLMTGYAGDPEKTSAILRNGVLYTSDSGVKDEKGQLHLKGRSDDVINVGGFKVDPLEVENAAMGFEGLADCLCVPVPDSLTGNAVKLIVVMSEGRTLDKRSLALYLRGRLEPYKVPMRYELAESIRRTFNGKPDRKSYVG